MEHWATVLPPTATPLAQHPTPLLDLTTLPLQLQGITVMPWQSPLNLTEGVTHPTDTTNPMEVTEVITDPLPASKMRPCTPTV